MNMVLTFLNRNWQRLQLDRFGTPERLCSVMITPRFQASGHIIVFVFRPDDSNPILVVKFPRMAGDHQRLEKEAFNLNKIQTLRKGGLDSVPHLIAFEDCYGHKLLVETLVPGEVMRPALVRSQPEICLQAALQWIIELHQASSFDGKPSQNWLNSLVDIPLQIISHALSDFDEHQSLVQKTADIAAPLRENSIAPVFEHGDFSSPNLLINEKGQLGVVDWELAQPAGLPAADLFFFLTYIAFARSKADKTGRHIPAIDRAFFHPRGWTAPYLLDFCRKTGVKQSLMKPLFILTWSRYVAGLIERLGGTGLNLSLQTEAWLRSNRYFLLWRHSVQRIKDFVI